MMSNDPRAALPAFWDGVYSTRESTAVSWFVPHLAASLELLDRAGLGPSTRLIDVGGGASTLVDDLLERGLGDITVLDLSDAALAIAKERLGSRANHVQWLVGDVTTLALPVGRYDLWHDRAVLHFLTDPADAAAYAAQAARAVAAGGQLLVAGFAPDGPERCSGLPVARRSVEDIAALFGPVFRVVETVKHVHTTPSGGVQAFLYVLLQHTTR